MRRMKMNSVLEMIRSLPGLPETYNQLRTIARNPSSGAADLTRVINTDTSLAAKILHVANTPFYGMNGRVETVARGVVILGAKTVCSIALGAAAFEVIKELDHREESGLDVWKHCLQTAIAARELAEYNGTIDPDIAFTGGLLHDMGKLVLATMFPEAYRNVLDEHAETCRSLTELEDRVFGIDHAAAGAVLCSTWKLPHTLKRLVENHHDGSATDSEASVVSSGNVLARLVTPHASGKVHVSLDELDLLFRQKRRIALLRRLVVSQAMQSPVTMAGEGQITVGIDLSDERLEQAIGLISLACGYTPLKSHDAVTANLIISDSHSISSDVRSESLSRFVTTSGEKTFLNAAALHRSLLFNALTPDTRNSRRPMTVPITNQK